MSYKTKLSIEDLSKEISYNKTTGKFRRLSTNNDISLTENNPSRVIKVFYKDSEYKIPASIIAWGLSYNDYPDGYIMHKNMNKYDFRLSNLKLVTKRHLNRATRIFKEYSEGYRPKKHPSDQYKAVVDYYDGKNKKKIFEDWIAANQFIEKYLKRYIKRKLEQLGVDL